MLYKVKLKTTHSQTKFPRAGGGKMLTLTLAIGHFEQSGLEKWGVTRIHLLLHLLILFKEP